MDKIRKRIVLKIISHMKNTIHEFSHGDDAMRREGVMYDERRRAEAASPAPPPADDFSWRAHW
jgi:hypothetical protein